MHYNLHLAEKEGFDNGFGGQAWTSLKMTNDGLKAGIYTVVFEIFTRSAVSPPILSDETLITEVYGDGNYNVTRRSKIVSRAVGRCVVMSSADHLWCAEVLQINP